MCTFLLRTDNGRIGLYIFLSIFLACILTIIIVIIITVVVITVLLSNMTILQLLQVAVVHFTPGTLHNLFVLSTFDGHLDIFWCCVGFWCTWVRVWLEKILRSGTLGLQGIYMF